MDDVESGGGKSSAGEAGGAGTKTGKTSILETANAQPLYEELEKISLSSETEKKPVKVSDKFFSVEKVCEGSGETESLTKYDNSTPKGIVASGGGGGGGDEDIQAFDKAQTELIYGEKISLTTESTEMVPLKCDYSEEKKTGAGSEDAESLAKCENSALKPDMVANSGGGGGGSSEDLHSFDPFRFIVLEYFTIPPLTRNKRLGTLITVDFRMAITLPLEDESPEEISSKTFAILEAAVRRAKGYAQYLALVEASAKVSVQALAQIHSQFDSEAELVSVNTPRIPLQSLSFQSILKALSEGTPDDEKVQLSVEKVHFRVTIFTGVGVVDAKDGEDWDFGEEAEAAEAAVAGSSSSEVAASTYFQVQSEAKLNAGLYSVVSINNFAWAKVTAHQYIVKFTKSSMPAEKKMSLGAAFNKILSAFQPEKMARIYARSPLLKGEKITRALRVRELSASHLLTNILLCEASSSDGIDSLLMKMEELELWLLIQPSEADYGTLETMASKWRRGAKAESPAFDLSKGEPSKVLLEASIAFTRAGSALSTCYLHVAVKRSLSFKERYKLFKVRMSRTLIDMTSEIQSVAFARFSLHHLSLVEKDLHVVSNLIHVQEFGLSKLESQTLLRLKPHSYTKEDVRTLLMDSIISVVIIPLEAVNEVIE